MNTHFNLCVHMCTHNSYTIIIFLYWIHPLQPWKNFTFGISRLLYLSKITFFFFINPLASYGGRIFIWNICFFSKSARCYVWFLYVLCGCRFKLNIGYENHPFFKLCCVGLNVYVSAWFFYCMHHKLAPSLYMCFYNTLTTCSKLSANKMLI